MAVLNSLSSEQKAQMILQSNLGSAESDSMITEVFNSVLTSSDPKQLDTFFAAFTKNAEEVRTILVCRCVYQSTELYI